MLATNSTLQQLNLSNNFVRFGSALAENKDRPAKFARALSVGLRDNGAISSINLLKNQIPVEQAQELVKIMQAKENLITLCGLRREETELDFSSQNLGAGDAVLIANDISDMRALSVLNLASNSIGGYYTAAYEGQALRNQTFTATPEGTCIQAVIVCICVLTCDFKLQARPLSPTPSRTWGPYRR
jgi:hypothetical protein